MKLKDILARKFKAWPEDCESIEQDRHGSCLFKVGGPALSTYVDDIADDAETAKVTRAEWQAAVEALKAEQAAELKWPDGAEFMGTTGEGCPKVFYRNVGGDYEYRYERDTCWSKNVGKPSHSPLIPRPTERAVEWDGAGLPPVGAEIEALLQGIGSTTYFWKRAKVVHGALPESGGEILVFSLETTRPAWVYEFRPIRTQEQIAAEEREKAIEEMVYGACGCEPDGNNTTAFVLCGLLYDASYRKQVAE